MSGFLEELLGEKLVTGGGEEVDVHSLAARGISLLGLYFGCSLSAPCAQLSASLAAFYGRLRGDAAAGPGAGAGPGPGAGAAAEPESRRRLEIVFVSSDQDQRQWQDFVRDMPWLALPYKEKHRKLKLWNKYRISNIPSLIFLDATTGKVVCRNGLLVIRDDPEGLEFPWGPKPFREVIAGPLLRNNGQSLESSSLEGSHVGVYFSAHWCPPCRSLTRVLVESYRKIKEAGQKFEIIFVSADRSEDSFKQYFSEMPWLAVPYTDEARRSRLNRLYGIQDSEDDGESEAAKQLIQPIAEKIIAKYKAKEEEAPLLFFVAGEDDMTDSLRDYTNLPEAAPLLTILDMSARAKYVMDVEEITPAIVEAFVNDFLAEKLKPEPI
ncbi:nucleoredoxin isoform X2 [Orcinus orca]|uniref:Nucleoredoxin isoform X2 n=1 Tax=Tursiops truncatus TaxID=9739 RepID=A0A6J3QPT3_TURTR|nr:nucleoredoxin isoform X2 [Lagenorhynchus obliquidens]XP_029066884.1 nucleoredoxin isoform X2 [Monodon monoceros]XP_030717766.1 nucleoredoxin isoform X2 [Globicephala melas]XP_032472307.1 nucleoredoxin isoform X2 [Phocoena sinus]XP_033279197.1 nucleoredoxin isoform X2 [Orcinus orca]XP_033704262.1 nucleoredoxin isoform X2 [Tursiops truncatus]XP_059988830.1 nucleoredoxin isoform X2 [Lagenorhynchus albirostris]